MRLLRLRCAALLTTAVVLSACLDVPEPPEGPPSGRPPAAAADEPDGAVVGEPARCDETFGSAPGYQLCAETESTCSFVTGEGDGGQFTCDERCAAYGSVCVAGFDTDAPDCDAKSEDGCASSHETQICVCQRTTSG